MSNLDSLTCGVALCTFNGLHYLDEQLASLLTQNRRPDQVVIFDDGSTDGTWEFAQKWAQGVPFPVVLYRHDRRLGIVANFEAAVQALDTELIFLCDQDDIWLPQKIQTMVHMFAQQPDMLLLHGDARLVDATARDLGVSLFDAVGLLPQERRAVKAGQALEILCRRNLVTGATAAFRRRLLEAALPFPACWLHDEWLAIIAAACGHINLLEEPIILYRQHGANAVGMPLPKKMSKLLGNFTLRGEFHLRRAERITVLAERLAHLSQVSVASVELVRSLQEHAEFRAHLPSSVEIRIFSVLQEWGTGRYQQFSHGLRGALRDIANL